MSEVSVAARLQESGAHALELESVARHFGALVALSDYNAFGTLGRFGFFRGGFIKGRFAQLSHAVLYRRHQLSLHGPWRFALLFLADQLNGLVQPKIRIS